jgi:hypothetical protein
MATVTAPRLCRSAGALSRTPKGRGAAQAPDPFEGARKRAGKRRPKALPAPGGVAHRFAVNRGCLVDAVSPERNDGFTSEPEAGTSGASLAAPVNKAGPPDGERAIGSSLFVCRNRDPRCRFLNRATPVPSHTVKRPSFIINPSPPLGRSITGLLPAKEHR